MSPARPTPDAPLPPRPDAVSPRIVAALRDLLALWRARYGVAIATLELRGDQLTGQVLTRKQAADAVAWAQAHARQALVVALEDSAVPPPRGWARVETPTPLFREPEARRLQTEALPHEGPMRRLAVHGAREVVQVPDGALGWVDPSALIPCAAPPRWPEPPRWAPGEIRAGAAPVAALLDALAPWLGAPYRLGGRSPSGVDCSGLVGALVWSVAEALMPRHSGDQRACGRRVSRAELAPGDLLFARMRERGVSHVGWVLPADPGAESASALTVAHASQRAGAVVREPLTAFESGYAFAAARRLWTEVEAERAP